MPLAISPIHDGINAAVRDPALTQSYPRARAQAWRNAARSEKSQDSTSARQFVESAAA
jgi:hypothetical protein